MKKIKLAPKHEYDSFGKYFPYSTVDVIISKNGKFILTKRTILPYKGKWHLPGGIIRKGHSMKNTAIRISKQELGLDIKIIKFLGTYENPIRTRHDISHVFLASISKGMIENDFQSSEVKFFSRPPMNIVPYHCKILSDAKKYLKK